MARYSQQHKVQTQQRIVRRAAVLLRQKGLHGVGVADLMHDAGLTHGGFYAHFDSKEVLIAAACREVLARTAARLRAAGDSVAPLHSRQAIVEAYLTREHRDDPGRGCAIAALGNELAREGPPVRQALIEGLEGIFAVIAECVPSDSADMARQESIAQFATLVGTMLLARAVSEPALSDEILAAGRAALLR